MNVVNLSLCVAVFLSANPLKAFADSADEALNYSLDRANSGAEEVTTSSTVYGRWKGIKGTLEDLVNKNTESVEDGMNQFTVQPECTQENCGD